ncbi:threonine-phosphate decarboxylase CobD [Entomohabitans teleogrylli]|uniref:threonine-phosphate decarboxylase CobD n=1 Tax=Entomohabitans teleogrylli TaxID=1384589 RepID=UPI00073D7BA3|nr:threonine-phosphate decarboxylase CobD [Entomohabitans teleogrylli]
MSAFVSQHGGNIREAAARYGMKPEQLLDFSANINPLGMPPAVRQAIVEQMQLAERYPDVEYQALHQAIARHLQVPVSWLLAGNGETELIFALVEHLAPRRALLVVPGFAEYRRALIRVGCAIEEFVLEADSDWQLDEAFIAALHPGLDCLFLCTPNNPTGVMPPAPLLLAIARRCAELDIALIVDEAFVDFIPQTTGMIPALACMPHVWVLRSLTKFFAIPGLRLGYMVSANPGVATIRLRQPPWTINAFAALAGERVLSEREYIAATHRWLADARSWLTAALQAITALTVWPSSANYLFLRCERPGVDLQDALMRRGILIRHCANYPGLDKRYYRVAVKSEAANQRLVKALQAIFSDTVSD